jgi:hypothetical protein
MNKIKNKFGKLVPFNFPILLVFIILIFSLFGCRGGGNENTLPNIPDPSEFHPENQNIGDRNLSLEMFMYVKLAGEEEQGYQKIPEYSMAYFPFNLTLVERCFDKFDNDNNFYFDCSDPDCFLLLNESNPNSEFNCLQCNNIDDCPKSTEYKKNSCIMGKCVSLLSYNLDSSVITDNTLGCGPCGRAAINSDGSLICEKDEEYLKKYFNMYPLGDGIKKDLVAEYGLSEEEFSCFDNFVTCEIVRNNSFLDGPISYYGFKVKEGCCINDNDVLEEGYYCSSLHKIEPLPGYGEEEEEEEEEEKIICDGSIYLNNGYCGCERGDYVFINMASFSQLDDSLKKEQMVCANTFDFSDLSYGIGDDNHQYFVLDYDATISFEVEDSLNKKLSFKAYSDQKTKLTVSLYSLNRQVFKGFSLKHVGFYNDDVVFDINDSISFFNSDFELVPGSYVLKFEVDENSPSPIYLSQISFVDEDVIFSDSKRFDFSRNSYSHYSNVAGICPKDWCWTGVSCSPDLSAAPFIKPSILSVNGSGYRCIKGEWVYSELRFDPTYSYQGYCEKQDSCLIYPQNSLNCGNYMNNSEGVSFCEKNDGVISCMGEADISNPQCIDNGRSIENHVCVDGHWVSKTSYDVELLKKLFGENKGVIYCDNYNNVLETPNYREEGSFAPWLDGNLAYDESSCVGVSKSNNNKKSYLFINFKLTNQFYSYDSLFETSFIKNLFGKESLSCELDDLTYDEKFNWRECLRNVKNDQEFKLYINPFKGKALVVVGDVSSILTNPVLNPVGLANLFGVDLVSKVIEKRIDVLEEEMTTSFKLNFAFESNSENNILTYAGAKNNYDVYYYNSLLENNDDFIEALILNKMLFVSKYDYTIWSSRNDVSQMLVKYPNLDVDFCDEVKPFFESNNIAYNCSKDSNTYVVSSDDTETFLNSFNDLTAKLRFDNDNFDEMW